MGQAKSRGTASERAANAATRMLGSDPYKSAYDAVFSMVEAMFGQTGAVQHQLLGMEFREGKIIGMNSVRVQDEEAMRRIPGNIDRMLVRWPLVAHVCEAWTAPPEGIPASEHPERIDIISITLHMATGARNASCPVKGSTREVTKAELLDLSAIGGTMGRTFDTLH